MYREIKKDRIILGYRKPFSRSVNEYIDELNYVDWIYSSMRFDGSALTRQGVQRILKGEFIVEATVADHILVENYKKAIQLAYEMVDMEIDLDEKYMFKLYEVLVESEPFHYRKMNPVLVAFDYNPPHPQEIEERMEQFVHWMKTETCGDNPLLKATYLHNKCIEIYPFEQYCEALARMLMNYELIHNGLPPVGLELTEQQYNKAVIAYLKRRDVKPIYEALEKATYNKLEILLQLTKQP